MCGPIVRSSDLIADIKSIIINKRRTLVLFPCINLKVIGSRGKNSFSIKNDFDKAQMFGIFKQGESSNYFLFPKKQNG